MRGGAAGCAQDGLRGSRGRMRPRRDKEDVAKTAMLNADHARCAGPPELGADDDGGDMLYEIKVPSPTVATYSAGQDSRGHGGVFASVGHCYGFGSTGEEKYRVMILGAKGRGRQRDGPFDHAFDHSTGRE